MTTMTLADVQKLAEALSKARDELDASIQALHTKIDAIKGPMLPEIRNQARRVAALHRGLAAEIERNPELFAKPRTYVVEGIQFGMRKAQPAFEWDSDDALCVRIHLAVARSIISAEQAELLITRSEKPVVAAIKQLDPAVLVKLGVDFKDGADAPLIKSVDDSVEKAVGAMIKDATKNLDKAEA